MSRRAFFPVLVAAALALGSLAQADTVQNGSIRVAFSGNIAPRILPRRGKAPIKVSVGTKVIPLKGKPAPQMRRLEIAINRNGVIDTQGLPVCPLHVLQPSTTTDALHNCRGSLVGEGLFEAKVLLKGQASFPSKGKLYAFNSRVHGRPAILAHVYGTQPAPASFTLIFEIRRSRGTFGTVLTSSLPEVTANSGYVTGLSLTLGKQFSSHGHRQSYASAGCPAPKGFPGAVFPFARATVSFAGGKKVSHVMTRSCRARG
ncbi:MAG TPA: hypothetical protein VFL77_09920 [Solirubrobacterales bacterium]|nr:hypothetical protein [Solirubrobacterales bacterium]